MGTPTDVDRFLPLPHLPLHVLLALADSEPLHGWGVIKRIDELTQGKTCPSTGSLYLAMARLRDRGLLDETPAPPGETDPRRKYYRLTPLGRRVLAAETHRLARIVDAARAADVLEALE